MQIVRTFSLVIAPAAALVCAPALALPFTAPVSGGPTNLGGATGGVEQLVDRSGVFWSGPFDPAGYTGLPVRGEITITAEETYIAARDGFLGRTFRYFIDVESGDGAFPGELPDLSGSVFLDPIEVVAGQEYRFTLSATQPFEFLLDIDPAFNFLTDPLFTFAVFVFPTDYEDLVTDVSQVFSFDGFAQVGTEVPAPGVLALFGLGALAVARRRMA